MQFSASSCSSYIKKFKCLIFFFSYDSDQGEEKSKYISIMCSYNMCKEVGRGPDSTYYRTKKGFFIINLNK